MADVRLTGVTKSFGTTQVLKGVDLEIADGEFVVFVGPSGCGKSTLLRTIAGLEEATGGDIAIGGKIVNDLGPSDRGIAMVFQSYALYPHMSVYENMAFGLKLARADKAEIDRRVRGAAGTLNITDYLDRKPKALSGGQRQRVAIGRAIVRHPQVFLMDEPLSNLDAKLRNQMRAELIKLRQNVNTTFVYVTHDQTEAMTLGDRIVIMKDGYIQQIGTPQQVFNHPANLFVAGFIGSPQMNFFDAQLSIEGGRYVVRMDGAIIDMPEEMQKTLKAKNEQPKKIVLGIRPEHIVLTDAGHKGAVPAKVDVSEMMGSELYVHVNAVGKDCVLRIATIDLPLENRLGFKFGDQLYFTFDGALAHLFDPETSQNLL